VKRTIAALGILVALTASACGGPSKQEKYARAVNADVEQFGQSVIGQARRVGPSHPDEQQAVINEAQAADALARDLARLKPPKSARGEHAQLVSVVRGYAGALRQARSPLAVSQATRLAIGQVKAVVAQINGSI
jgi:hypothetical protein